MVLTGAGVRSALCGTAAVAALAALSACQTTIVGDWRLVRVIPNPDEFCLENVQFTRDGGFAATLTLDGRTARETGTYRFTGFHLTLHPAAGGQRRYDAQLKLNRLEVRRGRCLVTLERGKSRNAAPPPAPDERGGRAADGPQPEPPGVIHEGSPP